MKNIFKILIGACVLSSVFSCDYERINTNPYEYTEEQGIPDDVNMGAPLLTMQGSVFPVGTAADQTDFVNAYQTAYLLSVDGWSGYFGEDNNWFSGSNHLTYYLQNDWNASTYRESYTKTLPAWKKIKAMSEKNNQPEMFALAQILKISAWHKTLEAFGPIPYTMAGEDALVIPFDSEEDVYNAMFADLKSAVEVLTPLAEVGTAIAPDYDVIYAGDTGKWVKYANSLMLRLAMRLKYIKPELAKQWAMEAYGNNISNLISAKNEEAQVSKGAGYVYKNNIEHCAFSYGECAMGTSMFAYLNGYKDPRLSKYFTPSTLTDKDEPAPWSLAGYDGKSYSPVPPGTASPQKTFGGASRPNFTSTTPTYWLRASEVYFLLAEAALEWSEFGNAGDWYRKGIEMSFEEWEVPVSAITEYLNDVNMPQDIQISFGTVNYSAPQPTQVTTNFNSYYKETALEQIMIQKWIALYPNGMEAWTEWRKTGYPILNEVAVNNSPEGATKQTGIRRMVYPISFQNSDDDKANYQDALQKLGGPDQSTTRLWWDYKN